MTARIEDWFVLNAPWVCGSQGQMKLHGVVSNHPKFNDGDRAVTSKIVSREGRTVITETGSLYYLGTANLGFGEYCNGGDPFTLLIEHIDKQMNEGV